MVYAQVIIGSRTAVQELTYIVPASIIPYIKPGSTVIVPLRKKNVRGVVVSLMRHVPRNLREKLRDISKIDKQGLGFTLAQIKTINDLARYYNASLAEVAYHALAWPWNGTEPKKSNRAKKPTFIQALWPERKKFYLELIEKYCDKSSFSFVFSSCQYLEDFERLVTKKNISIVTILSAKDEKNLITVTNQKEPFVALGLQKLAFLPLREQDFMIIDEPNYVSMTGLRRPYMSVKQVAITRSRNELFHLVFGANLLSFSDFRRRITQEWRVVERKLPKIELTIVDRPKNNEIVSFSLLEAIDIHNKCLFLVSSKVWAKALVCRECGHAVSCDDCGRTISMESASLLRCLYCSNRQPYPKICRYCHKTAFTILGKGSSGLFQGLEKVLPKGSIDQVSSLTDGFPENNVVVATEKILSFPDVKFDTAIVADIDSQLSGTNINGPWHVLNMLLFLRTISENIVIQTRFIDHRIWAIAGTGELNKFYEQELATRKQYDLPPYKEQYMLVTSNKKLSVINAEYKTILSELKKHMPTVFISDAIISSADGHIKAKAYVYSDKTISSELKIQIRKLIPFSWFLCRTED